MVFWLCTFFAFCMSHMIRSFMVPGELFLFSLEKLWFPGCRWFVAFHLHFFIPHLWFMPRVYTLVLFMLGNDSPHLANFNCRAKQAYLVVWISWCACAARITVHLTLYTVCLFVCLWLFWHNRPRWPMSDTNGFGARSENNKKVIFLQRLKQLHSRDVAWKYYA